MPLDLTQWNLSYGGDVFGPLFGGGSVKEATIRTLQLWLPSYIAEINRQLGTSALFVPKDYLYKPDERPIAPASSAVTVMVPRTAGVPERLHSSGTRATFVDNVQVWFAGTQDWNESEEIAWAYGSAVVGAIVQHPSLVPPGSDFAEATVLQSMALGPREERSSTLYRVSVMCQFHVVVANIVSPFGGPPLPSVGTPADLPDVTSENITVSQL